MTIRKPSPLDTLPIFLILGLGLALAGCDSSEPSPDPVVNEIEPPEPEQEFELLVSSSRTSSIRRYDAETGEYLGDLFQPRLGGLQNSQEVLFGLDGSILVTGLDTPAILRYDPESGEFLGEFTSGYALQGATKTTFGPDSLLYVSQWGQTQTKVARFDGVSGVFVDEFTERGIVQGMGHAWDEAGNLYVASMGTQQILKFDSDGAYVGEFAFAPGGMRPANIWFGEDGDLFAVDWQNGGVKRFDGSTGEFEGHFLTGLARVEGYAWAPDGSIFLCDWERNQIVRYSASGNRLEVVVDDSALRNPNSILIREKRASG